MKTTSTQQQRLQGKVTIVTGGHSGIGLATSRRFIEEGAQVVIVGRDEKGLDAAQRELGSKAQAIRADLGKLSELDRLFDSVRASHGRIDVLFLNAAIAKFAPLELVDEAHFDEQFEINVKGVLFSIQKALPLLSDGSSIIITSSVAGRIGMAGASAYSATKAAVRSLARTLAAELAPRGIRINIISPGLIETPIHGKLGLTAEQSASLGEQLITTGVPMRRIGQPEEVAAAAAFLASSDSSYMTGTEITVSGGQGEV